jgi:hypothetical protein
LLEENEKYKGQFIKPNFNKKFNNTARVAYQGGEKASFDLKILPEVTKQYQEKLSEQKEKQSIVISEKIKQAEQQKQKKFVGLEVVSDSNEFKLQIQKLGCAKFNVETRSWVMTLLNYYKLLERIKVICSEFQIHVQEIPAFVVNLMLNKTPCTGEGN